MKNKLDLIFPEWNAPPNIHAFSTIRRGGFSTPPYHGHTTLDGGLNLATHVGDQIDHVKQNRHLLKHYLPKEPLWLNQVHGVKVINAPLIENNPDADACISTIPNEVCIIQTADCLPILFCDSHGSIVAATHAGWRGLANGIIEKTLKHMREFSSYEIQAWFGPAIGPNHFEVGKDVFDIFIDKDPSLIPHFRPVQHQNNKYMANIYGIARHILEKQNINKISGGNFCTVSDTSRFYSYRRDGVTGRMATCIWMT